MRPGEALTLTKSQKRLQSMSEITLREADTDLRSPKRRRDRLGSGTGEMEEDESRDARLTEKNPLQHR